MKNRQHATTQDLIEVVILSRPLKKARSERRYHENVALLVIGLELNL